MRWSRHEKRKLIERVYLLDSEIYSEEELKEKNLIARIAMDAADKAAEAEQIDLRKRGFCPLCRCSLTYMGDCSMGCEFG